MQLNTNFITINLTLENGDTITFLRGSILLIKGEYVTIESNNYFSKLEMIVDKSGDHVYKDWSGEQSEETAFERIVSTPKYYNVCQISLCYLEEPILLHGHLPVEINIGEKTYLNDSKCEYFLDTEGNLHINCYRINNNRYFLK